MKPARGLLVLFVCALHGAAHADTPDPSRFGVGIALTGGGDFGTGLFSAGLPGDLGVAVRLELPNLVSRGVGVRADVGTDGAAVLVQWRADLSMSFNLTLAAGFGLSGYTDPALTGRFGVEYRISSFGFALEYGILSTFGVPSPTTRSRFVLGALWFFG